MLLALVALLGFGRQRSHLRMVTVERDSIASSFKRYVRLRQAVTFAGDTLPDARVLGRLNDTLTLRALADRGYRYLYFYRSDCLACQTLAPLLTQASSSVRARTAYIRYGSSLQFEAEQQDGHFAWFVDSAGPRPVGSVPALLVLGEDGIVTATADFDARAVVSLMTLHGLLTKAGLDSAIAAVGRVATPPSATAPDPPE